MSTHHDTALTVAPLVLQDSSAVVGRRPAVGVVARLSGRRCAPPAPMYTPNAWVHIADDNTITLISRALRDGPGRLHLDADADRRGAERRPEHDQGRDRAAQRQALRQRAARRPAAHRRLDLGARRLGKAAHRRRPGARDADRGGGRQVERRPRRRCKAENGMVIGPGGKKATYGQLAEAASKLPVPEKVALKDPSEFTHRRQARSSAWTRRPRSTARPSSASTSSCPAWCTPSLEQCPVIGGKVKSFDASQGQGACPA